ncbi:MAG: lipid-binding protein [Verrucomicrobia bacterium]|nr:lipid-binding protein [Verrucomicrobiota bacterium]|tara:strand:- start:195 stop:788 length:594 start_codon:yes stop_codon:yes gene_type:complete
MKKFASILLSGLLTLSVFAGGDEKKTYKIQNKLSSVEWIGQKITGSHEGTIMIQRGAIMVEDGKIVEGAIAIDMNSISVTDIENEKQRAKLKGHLTSDDFFGVEKYPVSRFIVVNAEPIGEEQYQITGKLEIKGIQEGIQFPAIVKIEGNNMVVVGEVEIDRTKFGIKYGSGSFFDDLGDRAIYDNFKIKFKIAASM